MTQIREDGSATIGHVGWGEKHLRVDISNAVQLGTGRLPRGILDEMVWDAALGYVSGFRKRDILYYILTRDTPLWHGMWQKKGQTSSCVSPNRRDFRRCRRCEKLGRA